MEPNSGPGSSGSDGTTVRGDITRNNAYRTFQSRMDTFGNWPLYLVQRPGQMAEAGWFYMGIDDNTRCFACGCTLMNWEPEDDPWKEHCRWSPHFPHVREVKGDHFMNQNQPMPNHPAAGTRLNQVEFEDMVVEWPISNPNTRTQSDVEEPQNTNVNNINFPAEGVQNHELVQQDNNDTETVDACMHDVLERPNVVFPELVQRGAA
ncbi:hypothetical protein DPMN_148925 [Dreissena polymorpha]|uniref:Uncharacterized protein n=1 Tax=Dreissena polymorpha TaxID=45954 RepID=A0A9D4FF01_DREPO|nr:hypothetical protein DPMN_148925 [Dreissena polymorpha]